MYKYMLPQSTHLLCVGYYWYLLLGNSLRSAICLHSLPIQGGGRPGILKSFMRRSRTAGRKTRGRFSFYQRTRMPPLLGMGSVLWRPRKCHCWQEHSIWLSHAPAVGRICSISPTGQDSTSGRGGPIEEPSFPGWSSPATLSQQVSSTWGRNSGRLSVFVGLDEPENNPNSCLPFSGFPGISSRGLYSLRLEHPLWERVPSHSVLTF